MIAATPNSGPEDDVRPAAREPAKRSRDLSSDQLADEAGEEHREQRAAELLDVEAMDRRQIGRHPGQEPIENGVEEHPAEAHAPHGTIAEIGPDAPLPTARGKRILVRVSVGDVIGLGLIDGRMVRGIVADVPPGEEAAEHRADTRHDEGNAATSRIRRSGPR